MRYRIHIAILVLSVVTAGGAARLSSGQGLQRTESAVVTYVAGTNIYIDLGADRGLASGDTLVAAIEGRKGGLLRVISSSSARSVLTFAASPFPVSRGNTLLLTFDVGLSEPDEGIPGAANTTSQSPRSSIMRSGPVVSGRSRKPAPSVDGRLSISYHTLSSTTRAEPGSGGTERSFTTPSVRLRMTVRNLPGRLAVNTSVSATYRQTSYAEISPIFLPRLYRLSLSREFDRVPGTVEVGRFYSRFENFSGYWDGIIVHVGEPGFGGGIASGFQPDRANENFGTDLPKHMAYMHFAHDVGEGRYSTDLSFHTVRPRNDLLDHTFFGWRQSWRNGAMTFSSEVQADRDPEEYRWVVTRLTGRAVIPIGPLRLRAGYSQTRPYSIWRATSVISYRRDRLDMGTIFVLPGASLSLGVVSNRTEGGDPYLTYTSFFTVSQSPSLGIGISGSSSYWSRDGYTAFSGMIGIRRQWSVFSPAVSYQYYRTRGPADLIITHAISLSASVRVSSRLGASFRSRTQIGELLFGQAYSGSIWVNF